MKKPELYFLLSIIALVITFLSGLGIFMSIILLFFISSEKKNILALSQTNETINDLKNLRNAKIISIVNIVFNIVICVVVVVIFLFLGYVYLFSQ